MHFYKIRPLILPLLGIVRFFNMINNNNKKKYNTKQVKFKIDLKIQYYYC